MKHEYGNSLEAWKVQQIRLRTARWSLAAHDAEEIVQALVLAIKKFCYEEARARGASERTVLSKLIDRKILALVRAKRRQEENQETYAQAFVEKGPDAMLDMSQMQAERQFGLREDLRAAFATLTEEEQLVCNMLMQEQPQSHIAKRLGGPYKLRRALQSIREKFQKAGVNEWLGG